MRPIKFRAWDKVNKRMGYFEPGFSWCDEYYTWNLSTKEGTQSIMDVPPGENIVFMQYTGLKDGFGKEIYEGDLLQYHSVDPEKKTHLRQVVWDKERAAFRFLKVGPRKGISPFQRIRDDRTKYHEVIGNIYENPELTH